MKMTPVSQGSGVPAGAAVGSIGMPADRIAAAKAVAAGKTPFQRQEPAIDRQADRIQTQRIKMRTNRSTNRDEQILSEVIPDAAQDLTQSATSDVNEQASEVTEDIKPLSPQFAALAKQRRALQTERAALDAEKKEFELSKGSHSADSDFRTKLKASPLATLLSEGVTYDQLTEELLADQSGLNPEIQKLRNEIKALKEGVDKNLTDRDAQAEAQVLAEMEREAKSLVQSGDDFELVRGTASVPKAIDLIKRTYKASGEILDVQEALQLVEDELVNDSLKYTSFKKVQSRLQVPSQQQTAQPAQNQMRTLTSRGTSTAPLSARQRAIAAFQGQLRK